MNEKTLNIVANCPIFCGIDSDMLSAVLTQNSCLRTFGTSETVFSSSCTDNCIGIIISGAALVFSDDSTKPVLLRKLVQGDLFGVSNVLSGEKFISRISAQEKCEVLFIPADAIRYLLEHDKKAMYNYIGFLSDRICFLNRKIACLTAGNAERRLALYLDSLSESDDFVLPLPLSSLATVLDIGRASLYRAFDSLVADGFISKSGKNIKILKRQEMLCQYI